MAGPPLTRDTEQAIIAGVCAGIAARYDFDVALIRIVTVLFTLFTGGFGVPIYIAAWIVMPQNDTSLPERRSAAKSDGLSSDLREVGDRLTEAARVLASKTREAAEELAQIARRARATETTEPTSGTSDSAAEQTSATAGVAAPQAPETTVPEVHGTEPRTSAEDRPGITHPPPDGLGRPPIPPPPPQRQTP